MPPTVSIVIVTYNSAEHLAACLESLRALRYEPAPEVVIVDNASRDGSLALARGLLPEALILPQERNLGFAGGVNRGVAAAAGEVIALLNPDAAVDPGWLAALVGALADPGVGIAGSKIRDRDGKLLLHTGGELRSPLLLTSHRGDGERDQGQYEAPADLAFVTGAALALRRELWDALGGLDEGFFPAYFEDMDLCARVRARGLACRYVPAATLRHVESASTGKYGGAFYYYYHRGRWRYACKHLGWERLWGGFCPAEARRLSQEAPALDRLIAALVYREGLPQGLALPDAAEQVRILDVGRTLAAAGEAQQHTPAAWPEAVRELLGVQAALATQLELARQEAALHEHEFQSGLPLVAALRRAWNGLATRWYVLPLIHQQTRVNLALSRALDTLATQVEAGGVPLALWPYQAAMAFRVAQLEARLSPPPQAR
jgi:O-antigen biosynthesis protein